MTNDIEGTVDETTQMAEERLAALKAKLNKDSMPPQIVAKKTRSLKLGVVGSGQMGGRPASCWAQLGYDAIAINTAPQDLEYIELPSANKLLLNYGVGGASKELEIGKAAAEMHKNAIAELVYDKLSDSQVNVLCFSLGGGSGAGSCEVLIDLLSELGKPLIVIAAMPMAAEAVVNNLNGNLLASGFNLKQSKYVGFIVVANEKVWKEVPASSINYATAMINELCGDPKGVFKGIYTTDLKEDVVKVYSFFSGLGLPTDRVDQLKGEIKALQGRVKEKDDARTASLQLDTGATEVVSMAQKVKDKIAQKSSMFGKFISGTVNKK